MSSVSGIYIYTGPAFSLIVAAAFFGIWLYERHRSYILLFAAAFLLFAAASLSQMLRIPPDFGHNAVASAAAYALSIICLMQGVMTRLKVRGGAPVLLALGAIIVFLIYYFYYVERNLVTRIYIQNFGSGIMCLFAVAKIASASRTRTIDRIIFWILLAFGVHFFPRTILTMAVMDGIQVAYQPGTDYTSSAVAAGMRNSAFWQVLNFSLLISAFLVALTLLAAVAIDMIDDRSREGGIDALTGLANRRSFHRRTQRLSPQGAYAPVSMVYCDLDHFKSINDTYGHAAGDRVLQEFARLLEGEVRAADVAARFGGEEFVVMLARSDRAGAAEFAERVRKRLKQARFSALPPGTGVTASFGVAQWRAEEDLQSALHRADQMVYAAKRAGRDRVVAEARDPS